MYYFLSGLPRSGSTLLSAILNQNSQIHVSSSSPVVHLLWSNEQRIHEDDFYLSHPKPEFKKKFLSSIIDCYYSDRTEPHIIDKNRIWMSSIPLILNYISSEPKILCPVRPSAEIVQSFLKLMEMYPENVIDENIQKPRTLEKRCEYLLSNDSVLMSSISQILDVPSRMVHFIDYDSLIQFPQQTMKEVYQFLSLPEYEHDFRNIVNSVSENDEIYGMPTMHSVRPTLEKTQHTITLPDHILEKCAKIDEAIRFKMQEEHSYPSLPEQGTNLAKFSFELLKRAFQGQALTVSQEVKENRLSICRTCEWYDSEQTRCKHCGCYLEEKARFALDSCPIGKWKESSEDWDNGRFEELMKQMESSSSISVEQQTVPIIEEPSQDELEFVEFPQNPKLNDEFIVQGIKWKWNGIHWEYVS